MDENFFNIQLLLEVIRTDLIGIASSIVGLGRAIGAIGALLYTAMLAYNAMLTGASLFTMKTFKPFAFGLLLMMYPAFMTVLDGLAMAVNNGIGGAMITDENRITEVLKTRDLRPDTDTDENLLGSREIEQEESEDVRDLVNRFTDAVSGSLNAFQWIGQKIYSGFMEVFETILFTFARAILVLINTLRVFFLVVLYIAGPLIIGLSIFPGFEGSFAAWIGRYLSVHLWLGIGHIFEAIAMRFWRLLADEEGFWTQALGLEGTGDSYILTSWSWVFMIVIIFGYATIPMVSGWIITASGVGNLGSAAAGAASSKTVRTGWQGAKAAAGGIGRAAGGLYRRNAGK